MTEIQMGIGANCDNDLITSILSTDLSAAYDTVDHKILLNKLEHYGIRDNELEVINSFLNNRRQYVEIDGASSSLKFIGNQSVIQGSKWAGFFTLFIPMKSQISTNLYTITTTPQ